MNKLVLLILLTASCASTSPRGRVNLANSVQRAECRKLSGVHGKHLSEYTVDKGNANIRYFLGSRWDGCTLKDLHKSALEMTESDICHVTKYGKYRGHITASFTCENK